MENGIQFCLVNVNVNPVWRFKLVEVVLSQFPDIDDNTREGRMGVVANIIELNS